MLVDALPKCHPPKTPPKYTLNSAVRPGGGGGGGGTFIRQFVQQFIRPFVQPFVRFVRISLFDSLFGERLFERCCVLVRVRLNE